MKNSPSLTLGIVLFLTLLLVVSAAVFLLREEGETGEPGTKPSEALSAESEIDQSFDRKREHRAPLAGFGDRVSQG